MATHRDDQLLQSRARDEQTKPKSDVLVSAVGVHKWFGANHVLKGVDLEVRSGEVVALVGPSGSGKTTLLRCVNFLESYDGGEVRVGGQLAGYEMKKGRRYEQRPADLARFRSRIGMVFQHFNLFPHLSAAENVAYGPREVLGLPKAKAMERAKELLATVGLADKTAARPGSLSGGQQQRVGIARALAMDPELLLLDEPTSALDAELVAEVLSAIRRVADAGMTMIIVTHELGFARDVADTAVFLEGGHVVERGPARQLLSQPTERRTREFIGLSTLRGLSHPTEPTQETST